MEPTALTFVVGLIHLLGLLYLVVGLLVNLLRSRLVALGLELGERLTTALLVMALPTLSGIVGALFGASFSRADAGRGWAALFAALVGLILSLGSGLWVVRMMHSSIGVRVLSRASDFLDGETGNRERILQQLSVERQRVQQNRLQLNQRHWRWFANLAVVLGLPLVVLMTAIGLVGVLTDSRRADAPLVPGWMTVAVWVAQGMLLVLTYASAVGLILIFMRYWYRRYETRLNAAIHDVRRSERRWLL